MADKDGPCSDEGCESKAHFYSLKLKGPEKDLQTIFKKLRVDNGPKRLHRKARLVTPGSSRSRDNESTRNVKRILREPVFTYKNKKVSTAVYKNHHTLRMRRRRRKMSLELRTADELYQHHRESLSDSELECSKPVGSSKCQASTRSRSQQRLAQVSTGIAVDCGRQHRRLQCGSVQRMNFDDTTPEELASYFDQLLYFPKPMSAMAEMMYT